MTSASRRAGVDPRGGPSQSAGAAAPCLRRPDRGPRPGADGPDLPPGVIFHSPAAGRSASAERPLLPAHVAYTLRTSVTYSVRTDVVRNPFWKFHPQSLPADGFKYNYVFVPLQDMIETAIVLEQTGWEAAGPAARVQAAPYPCHSSDL